MVLGLGTGLARGIERNHFKSCGGTKSYSGVGFKWGLQFLSLHTSYNGSFCRGLAGYSVLRLELIQTATKHGKKHKVHRKSFNISEFSKT